MAKKSTAKKSETTTKPKKPEKWIFALSFYLDIPDGFKDKMLIPYPFMPLAAFEEFSSEIHMMIRTLWGVKDAHGIFESKDPNSDPYQYDITGRFNDRHEIVWTMTRRIDGREVVTKTDDLFEIFQAFEADVV